MPRCYFVKVRAGVLTALLIILLTISSTARSGIFNYSELPQKSLTSAPNWLEMMDRHLTQDQTESQCMQNGPQLCNQYDWYKFLNRISHLPKRQQIEEVNRFANRYPYILDINNYGSEDYWAILREFLALSGDCEDYSLTKYFSLRLLGFQPSQLRIVALQDTNLRIAHAVLAVQYQGKHLILDNQTAQILTDKDILHYAPLYSVNEKQWWMHLPNY